VAVEQGVLQLHKVHLEMVQMEMFHLFLEQNLQVVVAVETQETVLEKTVALEGEEDIQTLLQLLGAQEILPQSRHHKVIMVALAVLQHHMAQVAVVEQALLAEVDMVAVVEREVHHPLLVHL